MTLAFRNVRKFFLVALLIFPGLIFAQTKSYSYEAIDFDIQVNQDSTFDVTERQIFNYRGNFHAATRDIPLRLVSTITDVQVLDGATGQPLQFSAQRLDKLNPLSWGKYTRYRSGGAEHIEWYYNLTDAIHEWVIKYQVHGGLAFYRDHDELYWNLFTDYQVPIDRVEARVSLPPNQFSPADFKATIYASSATATQTILNNQTFLFTVSNLPSQEKLTIAAGWPKGLVSEQSYWRDWAKINWAYLLSLIIALGSFLYGFGFWLKHEKFNQGRGTIVAQYEPPEKLKPAMAEMIIKEKITDRAWSATVVDLAVRGHVSIIEDKKTGVEKIVKIVGSIFYLGFVLSLVIFFSAKTMSISEFLGALLAMLVLKWLIILIKSRGLLFPSEYLVLKQKSSNDSVLGDYEKEFLDILFAGNERFSTKELRQARGPKGRDFSLRLIALKKHLYQETERDTGAYEIEVSKEHRLWWAIIVTFVGLLVLSFFVGPYIGLQSYVLFATIILCTAALVSFVRHEARLSKEGQILKEEWLGFKLYLETAEKYRLQSASRRITPDLFEKYLPYAIVLGVEKKWGEAFRGINVSQPSWYGGTTIGSYVRSSSIVGSGNFGNFSASIFSASFSSSFTSAFASSGAGGGASGGGGGAGGGGGGGGGGAS